jgi:AraC family transcriptional regulator
MKIVDKLTSTLGPPVILREIHGASGPIAAVGRWRHRGACVDFSDSNTMQVVFNLTGGQFVDLRWRDHFFRGAIRAGSIGLVFPGNPAAVTISGEADTVQLILTCELVEAVTGRPVPMTPPQVGQDELLYQAAAAQALVAIGNGRGNADAELDRIMRRIAGLLGRRVTPVRPPRGGLAPGAKKCVRALIDEGLRADPCSPPALSELADAAKLSLYHFVRAYRETEGETPYARMLGRRIDASLALLLKDHARVDDVADAMGFSSPSHFVSAFRKRMGVTPGALRRAVYTRT